MGRLVCIQEVQSPRAERRVGAMREHGDRLESTSHWGIGTNQNGPVAQLGERLVCIQEVVGSIPVGSTRLDDREQLFRGRVASAGFPREQRGPGGTSRARVPRSTSHRRVGGREASDIWDEQAVTPDSIGAYSSVWLERTPDKREVGGSNPPRPTTIGSAVSGELFEEKVR